MAHEAKASFLVSSAQPAAHATERTNFGVLHHTELLGTSKELFRLCLAQGARAVSCCSPCSNRDGTAQGYMFAKAQLPFTLNAL